MQFIDLHHHAVGAVFIDADYRNGVFARKERHRHKANASSLVVFGKKGSIMVQTVTAVSHNPNARTFSAVIGGAG